jgi:predicted RNase H-like nuclease
MNDLIFLILFFPTLGLVTLFLCEKFLKQKQSDNKEKE